MTHDYNRFEQAIRTRMKASGLPSRNQIDASRQRVRERLRQHDVEPTHDRPRRTNTWRAGWLVAATLLVALTIVMVPAAGDKSYRPNILLRILSSFTKGMADTAAPLRRETPFSDVAIPAQASAIRPSADPDFEEASIKPCDPDNLPPQPDGGRGGGANSVQLTPGRLRALCMTPATLVRVAYGYGPMAFEFNRDSATGPGAMTFGLVYGTGQEDGQRVRGAADWALQQRYTIEAVAPSGQTPDAKTLGGPMLLRLLERRFQLKAHVEGERVPAYALTVAKGGLKIKPVTPDACDRLPGREGSALFYGYPGSVLTPPRSVDEVRRGMKPSCGMWGGRNGPNQVMIAGDMPLEILRFLGNQVGGVRVIDKTGITARFNFVLEYLHQDTGSQGFPDPRANLDIPPAADVFTALEEQLGLKLEKAQTSRDFIVVDRLERPSPN